MHNWIGNKPTFAQKLMVNQYKELLLQAEEDLAPDETIWKAIDAHLQTAGDAAKGLLILTDTRLIFQAASHRHSVYYAAIRHTERTEHLKEMEYWTLSVTEGERDYLFTRINRNDDSKELMDALLLKFEYPASVILTTVTFDFRRLLHAARLTYYQERGIRCTPFLIKRDNMGFAANGRRMLKEYHPDALFLTEASLEQAELESGNFLVLDSAVHIYQYDNAARTAELVRKFQLEELEGLSIDRQDFQTVISGGSFRLTVKHDGKQCEKLLKEHGVLLMKTHKKWHEKLLGFRIG